MARLELPSLEGVSPEPLVFTKDKAYQSYHPKGVFVLAPYKASRGHPLTGLEELTNSALAAIRIVCEHAISGVKRLRVLKE
ncbi:MAG: hypothetical protein D6772_06090 [Bacteroidetes bacterium]|nr:MAG: hypothetical protein D6772_06090 [Bacteroidota bacterium]